MEWIVWAVSEQGMSEVISTPDLDEANREFQKHQEQGAVVSLSKPQDYHHNESGQQ